MKANNYKAAIYRGIGNVEVVEMPYPQCDDDDVIVKNLAGGICGSDTLAFSEGGDAHYVWKDHEFGHEMVSEVVEVGKNVTAVKPGDYVWPHLGYAHRDRKRMATVGAFSEYIKVVGYEEGFSAFMLDKSLSLDELVLVEPFIIGTRGALSIVPGPGKTAVVFGAGMIGLSCALMLQYYGCDKVMVVDFIDYRLENAQSFGLLTCNPKTENFKERCITEFGSAMKYGGEGCLASAYVDCVGAQAVIDSFMEVAGPGAQLSVVGVHHQPVTLDFVSVCYNQLKIGGCGTTPAGEAIKDILDMMKSTSHDLSRLISHKFNIDQIEDALKKAGAPTDAQKVVITF
ncbi:zinc-binding dehydrogenase [Eubacteriaceae bacterium ES2]|nr:zinc-binding dehydrogenase [Eubacteriaceae bacterium ES2]